MLLGRVRGPHVPGVIDYFVDEAVGPMLVTELVEGRSLAEALEVPMSVEAAIELGLDLASGLSELHRASVVHRDLKPSNVILREDTEGASQAFIIDLGVSRLLEGSPSSNVAPITSADIFVGTLEYMAPERDPQLHGSDPGGGSLCPGRRAVPRGRRPRRLQCPPEPRRHRSRQADLERSRAAHRAS